MTGYVLTQLGIEKIESKRQELEKTQEQLSFDTCLNRKTISKAIQGNPDKPLHLSSIRRLFTGLELKLDSSDYKAVGTSTTGMKLNMNDRDELIKAAESLEAQANDLEAQGNSKKAAKLRENAANLRRIATQ